MRVSLSNATTTEADVDRAVLAVSAAWETLRVADRRPPVGPR
jgi:hypothetical protein